MISQYETVIVLLLYRLILSVFKLFNPSCKYETIQTNNNLKTINYEKNYITIYDADCVISTLTKFTNRL